MILRSSYISVVYVAVLSVFVFFSSCKGEKAKNTTIEKGKAVQDVDSSINFMLWGAPATEFNKEREIFLHAFVTTDTSGQEPIGNPPNYYYWYDAGKFWSTNGDIDSVYQIENTRIGNFLIAEKINRPNDPRSTAGIQYGEQGVCHQIANRTTYATYWTGSGSQGVEPLKLPLKGYPGADSYIVTFLLYGTYGRNSTPNEPQNYDFKQRVLAAGGDTSWIGKDHEILKKLLMDATGDNYSPNILEAHMEVKKELLEYIDYAYGLLREGEKTFFQIGEDINERTRSIFATKLKAEIGNEAYKMIYKENPNYPITVFNLEFCNLLDEIRETTKE